MNVKYGGYSMLWLVIGIMIATGLLLVGLIYFNSNFRSVSKKTNRQIVMTCTTDMATQFHIHPNLEIIINGQKQEIPANIGVTSFCMNAIHTHDNSGKLHVESPEKRDFTLSDFFAVWNKIYNKDQILDSNVDDKHIIKETVNGKETQDYENTILRDNDQILIYYEETQ